MTRVEMNRKVLLGQRPPAAGHQGSKRGTLDSPSVVLGGAGTSAKRRGGGWDEQVAQPTFNKWSRSNLST
jgi:hypothetical protein